MSDFDFDRQLADSKARAEADMAFIREMIPGVANVVKTGTDDDRAGVDYVATLRRGRRVGIDAKARERGCSRHWDNGRPELALERWSVRPRGDHPGIAGWTLSESNQAELILFTFDPADYPGRFLVAFQPLRAAFARSLRRWRRDFRSAIQRTAQGWESECVFVPADVVQDAIRDFECGGALQASPTPDPFDFLDDLILPTPPPEPTSWPEDDFPFYIPDAS